MRHWFKKGQVAKRSVMRVVAVAVAIGTCLVPLHVQAMSIPPSYGGVPVVVDPALAISGQTVPLYGWQAGGPPVIHLSLQLWAQSPEAVQIWTLEHELAHAMLHHLDVLRAWNLNPPHAVNAQLEWDADTAAAINLTKHGQGAIVDGAAAFMMQLAARGLPPIPDHAPWIGMAQHILAVKQSVR